LAQKTLEKKKGKEEMTFGPVVQQRNQFQKHYRSRKKKMAAARNQGTQQAEERGGKGAKPQVQVVKRKKRQI